MSAANLVKFVADPTIPEYRGSGMLSFISYKRSKDEKDEKATSAAEKEDEDS